jgi:hypothetical protein
MGVPDLDTFGRALSLWWLWQEWGDDPKPWEGTEVPYSDIDRLLLNSSTIVTIDMATKRVSSTTAGWRARHLDI